MNQVVDEDSELYDDLSCELDDIDEEIYKIEGDMMEYDAEEMKRAGAIITIDSEELTSKPDIALAVAVYKA
ncbi:hypothetical protein BGZ96_004319, partial [Linnemannia gamsii]